LSTKDRNPESIELDEIVEKFELQINKALGKAATFKSFIVKSHNKFGISNQTKLMMQKCELARSMKKMTVRNQYKHVP
jgi:hypothetical protein